jgi:tRNA-specific adenosine deaminase 1
MQKQFPGHTIDDNGFYKTAVSTVLDTYTMLEYVPHGPAWTVLASFFLSRKPNISLGTSGEIKVISLATGTKCLPTNRLSDRGEVVNDGHAEVLARRCALRWFLEEIDRCADGAFRSAWIERTPGGRYALQVGVELNLYVSNVPCAFSITLINLSSTLISESKGGDASTRFLASSDDDAASRGRGNYVLLDVLRDKPNFPASSCMSCSDKIAR